MKEDWTPKTKLGRLVANGDITTMEEALATGLPIMEPEIVDRLLPGLQFVILDSRATVRVTDSGKRRSIEVLVAVGNGNGYVGVGYGKAKEFKTALQKAIADAKKNIIRVRRGCGSWECGCGTAHSIPFKVEGKSGSVRITIKPAPKGLGIVAPDSIKPIFQLAGIKDVWTRARGNTRNTINFAYAVIDALKNLTRTKIRPEEIKKLGVDW
ncbi:MAG: small subunit ribosomal protein [Candidatus Diapherotrites archaeon]|nr:small subunit ribosomal protein [Candidatus Diapherotrites archaeon]MDN5366942.1 small subunit ribosomal protein [Candidatus Diapherotrites archaeon]